MATHVLQETINTAITKHIEQEVDAEFERQKTEMIEKLDRRKREIVAGIVLGITKTISMEQSANQLIIVVKEIEKPKGD